MSQTTSEQFVNQSEADERRHLTHVVNQIAAALSSLSTLVDARHSEMTDLKGHLQANKGDMDHVEKASVRQSVNMMASIGEHSAVQKHRLGRLLNSPYFGRIDLGTPDARDPRPIYIGIHSFSDSDTQMTHDWRAPVSSVFYEHELGDASYDTPSGVVACHVVRKRQYRIANKELLFMLETALNIHDDILQEELSRSSDDRMRNIVATIQRDQNAIIRNDRSHTLIIQGAAGSGKTSIALHRIAFLLYKHKDSIRSQDILIVSPNRVFAHYISNVLPELGEQMIQETTMEVFAATMLGHQVRFQTFAQQVSALLDRPSGSYAERVRFKATAEFLQKLDEYIWHVRETNFRARAVTLGPYTLDADWIADRVRRYARLPIADQITQVVSVIVEYMQTDYHRQVRGQERTRLRADLKSMFACTTLKALYKGLYDWLGTPPMFRLLPGGAYEYADVFPLIYLKMMLYDTPVVRSFKHVVIDEMQDYTPIQYQVIARAYPCRKTILGDRNQSVNPLSSSSAESIAAVLSQADCIHLNKSYRSTMQITELAQSICRNPDLIPIERHGEKPAIIACDTDAQEVECIRRLIHEFRQSPYKTMGIICKTQEQADRLHAELNADRQVRLLDVHSTSFSDGVMIATAYLAKGLEFDHVIVPRCTDVHYRSAIDRHMLYIGCTRAMHRLTLTHTGDHSPFLTPAVDRSSA